MSPRPTLAGVGIRAARDPLMASENDATSANYLEVDLGAIAHNTAQVRRLAGNETRIFAAVKANAYGFGIGAVADVVLASGADALAMVEVADAVKLRGSGIRQPILLYSGSLPTSSVVSAIDDYGLMPTLADLTGSAAYSSLASHALKAFVKVDVGLERNGAAPEAAVDLVKAIRKLPRIEIDGIYTHLHVPAQLDSTEYVEWQYQRFVDLLRALRAEGIDIPIQMAASSGVIRMTPDMMLNAIDPGHALYGLTASGREKVHLDLRPAFGNLGTRLTQVKEFRRSEFVERLPFEAAGVTRIGVVPFGQAHGMAVLNCGQVLVRGRRVKILGSPHVEHTRVDLTSVPDACVGDEVVIIGRQGRGEIQPQEVMAHQRMDRDMRLALEVRESVPRIYRTA
jgi:alanine racemase